MKYVLIIGDGMADNPMEQLSWRTPLQIAEHPNMDLIASKGFCGMLDTQPENIGEGTDVAILSILGYDTRRLHIGRGALEAASIGVDLRERDLAFRLNLITVKNGVLQDYSAGHISTDEAKHLIQTVNATHAKPGEVEFYWGVGYRHLLVLRGMKYSDKVICQPPHDNLDKPISKILVREVDRQGTKTAQLLNEMILSSRDILSIHPVNTARDKMGKNPANMIWPWGQGSRPNIQTLNVRYGINSAVISAVDVVKGLGIYAGMDVINVPGITGFHDTNYEGKADYALASLKDHDFILIHVEAPDEASHIGNSELKIRTIEDLDRRLIGRVLQKLENDYTIAILPDHVTSTELRTHTGQPVPFAIFSTCPSKRQGAEHFDEVSIKKSSEIMDSSKFMPFLLDHR